MSAHCTSLPLQHHLLSTAVILWLPYTTRFPPCSMVYEGFCAPCQAMLADEDIPMKKRFARPHHPDGKSFRQALDMGCHICTQSWVQFKRPDVLGRSTYYIWTSYIPEWFEFRIRLYKSFSEDHSNSGNLLSDTEQFLDCFMDNPKAGFMLNPWSIEYSQTATARHTKDRSNTWLSDSTGSAQSYAFLASQFAHCIANHQNCSNPRINQYLPTRLLDLGGEECEFICVVSREDIRPNAEYATFSHCWGQVVSQRLTRLTEAMLHSGIAVGDLPKTFQDAVEVSRKMKIPYLWIYSL